MSMRNVVRPPGGFRRTPGLALAMVCAAGLSSIGGYVFAAESSTTHTVVMQATS